MTDERMLMVANPRWSGRRGNLREIEVSFRAHGKEVTDLWRSGGLDVLSSPFVPERRRRLAAPSLRPPWGRR